MKPATIFIDVMQSGRFLFQLKYTRRGVPRIVGGELCEVHLPEDVERFVYQQRPSLRGRKGIHFAFSAQRVYS